MITVTKARASNLQFTEYGRINNLRSGSVAAGGGEFEVALVSPDGATLGEYRLRLFRAIAGPVRPPGWSVDGLAARRWLVGRSFGQRGQSTGRDELADAMKWAGRSMAG